MRLLIHGLIFLAFIKAALADTYCRELAGELEPILHEQFFDQHSPLGYENLRCETNAWHQAQRLNAKGFTPGQIEVVAIWHLKNPPTERRAKKNWLDLKPIRPRHENVTWAYHVFVLVDGFVLDPDFKTQPTLVSLIDYFNLMYLGEHENERIWISSWNSSTYNPDLIDRYGPDPNSTYNVNEYIKLKMSTSRCSTFSIGH